MVKALLQPIRALIRSYLLNAESDLRDRDGRQRQFGVMPREPGNDSFIRLLLQGLGQDIGIQKNQRSTP